MRAEVPEFARRLDEVLTATGTLASLALDFGQGSEPVAALPGLADNVETFGNTIGNNAAITKSLRDTIATTPRMTTAYNRARKAATDALDETERVLSNGSQTCLRVARSIRELVLPNTSDTQE
jgi:hypothetical protein